MVTCFAVIIAGLHVSRAPDARQADRCRLTIPCCNPMLLPPERQPAVARYGGRSTAACSGADGCVSSSGLHSWCHFGGGWGGCSHEPIADRHANHGFVRGGRGAAGPPARSPTAFVRCVAPVAFVDEATGSVGDVGASISSLNSGSGLPGWGATAAPHCLTPLLLRGLQPLR
jgi:hypothetical protein